MGVLRDLYVALICETPFKLAWMRARHIRNGHPFEDSVLVDKLRSEKHPHSGDEYIYTVNLRRCNQCGLIFQDCGLESRM